MLAAHVTLKHELEEPDLNNILEADRQAFQCKRDILDQDFRCRLRKCMFSDVLEWADEYSSPAHTLGVEPRPLLGALRQIIDDVRSQIEHQTYSPDEIAVRFHHQLIAVYPFLNGDKCWSRLAADILIVTLGGARFTWGRADLQSANDARLRYIDALHAADNHDFAPLMAFVRS
jgi:Fic-DOC domain mobile mystery protein B